MVPILGLINTFMANQYLPNPTKSGKDKGVQPECLALGNVVVKDTLRTHKQRTEVFFQDFTLLLHHV